MLRWMTTVMVGLIFVIPPSLTFGDECPVWAIDAAENVAGGVVFGATFCTELEIPSLHIPNLLLLRGSYEEDDSIKAVTVCINPENISPITMVRLRPPNFVPSKGTRVDSAYAVALMEAFFEDVIGEPFPPDDFRLKFMRREPLCSEMFWQAVGTQVEMVSFLESVVEIPVQSGFLLMEVPLEGDATIVTYAFRRDEVTVSTTPSLSADSAVALAKVFLADHTDFDTTGLVYPPPELVITYPNHIFDGLGWQWDDDQVLVWTCNFHELEPLDPLVTVWVNAHTGDIEGGEVFELATAKLFCIQDQASDCEIWEESLDEMGLHVDVKEPAATVSEVQSALFSDPYLFVLQGHSEPPGNCLNDPYGCGPSVLLDLPSSMVRFCPDDVPVDSLDIRWVLLSSCYTGNSCLHYDFESFFIDSAQVDLFQGYEGAVDPDLYERYQAYFLEQGETFFNVHNMVETLNPPYWNKVRYRWAEGACGEVRLAPVLVRAYSNTYYPHGEPAEAGEDTFRVFAEVTNWDDFRQTPAESVVVVICHLPSGFSLLSDSLQVRETLAYSETLKVFWDMMASPTNSGAYPVGIWVGSKNLGVALEDPGDSLWHRCWVYIVKDHRDWTVMVYADGDNSLDDETVENLVEMKAVGSSDSVSILVLCDLSDSGDTHLYYVEGDSLIMLDEQAPWLDSEENMGEPQTIVDFVTWAVERYPAMHYMLVLQDHGHGIWAECDDDTDGDYLTLPELDTALAAIKEARGGEKLDIVAHDACLMGQVETHYQMAPYANIGIASEAKEPTVGWHYTEPLMALQSNPEMTPRELAAEIVNQYVAYYDTTVYANCSIRKVTQAAVDLAILEDEFFSLVDSFAVQCSTYMDSSHIRRRIVKCRDSADTYYDIWGDPWSECKTNKDLFSFAKCITHTSTDSTVLVEAYPLWKAADTLTKLYPTVVFAESSGFCQPRAYGATIWFTPDYCDSTVNDTCYKSTCAVLYDSIRFAQGRWPGFLAQCSYYFDQKGQFVRGDAEADGDHDIFDGLKIIYWLGGVPPDPPCINACDTDDDEDVDIFDGLQIIYWLGGVPTPPEPPCCFPPGDCDLDPTPDGLTCLSFPPCGWNPRAVPTTSSVGSAQESRLVIEQAEINGRTVVVPVTLTNAEPLVGFSFVIEYDPELVVAKLVDNSGLVTEKFDVFASGVGDSGLVKVAAVKDMDVADGVEKLPAGGHRVARIIFEQRGLGRDLSLKVVNSVMAISYDRALNHTVVDAVGKRSVSY